MSESTATTGLVSVIMPFLNTRESFFLEAIESIKSQTYKNWELILIDDGSESSFTDIAIQITDELPGKIKYIDHEQHQTLGISASRNLGLSIAEGEYVAFLDADDVWNEEQLEEQVELLRSFPQAALLYGNTTYWRSWERRSGESLQDVEHKLGLPAARIYAPPTLLRLILQRRAISPCMTSVMVRRQVFLGSVLFEEKFTEHYEDQVFLAKVFTGYPVYVSDQCWGKYRQHVKSTTGDGDDSERAKSWRLKYLQWLSTHLQRSNLKGSSVWYSLQLELWMFQNHRVERVVEWLRLWRRRFRKVFGVVNVQ